MILNPLFNLKVAPKGQSYHTTFNEIPGTYRYCVFRSNDSSDLNNKFLEIKDKLESFDETQPVTVDGVVLDTIDKYVEHVKFSLDYIDDITDQTYLSKDLGVDYYDKEFIVSVFSLFLDNEHKVYTLNGIEIRNKLICSFNSFSNLHLHKEEPILSGSVNTNNKLSRWEWDISEFSSFNEVKFDISLWREGLLVDFYETQDNYFSFAESAINFGEGNFELIVLSKDLTGSNSQPAIYEFYIKTDIDDDIMVEIVNEDGDAITSTNNLTPNIKVYNYSEEYNYKIVFNGSDEDTYYMDDYENLLVDERDNSVIFGITKELDYGFHTLTVQKIDKIGNTTGSSYLTINGLINESFCSFNINEFLVPEPVILANQWISDTQILLSWSNSENIRNFRVYQGYELVTTTTDSFLIFSPTVYHSADTVINIYSYDYQGNRSINPAIVSISEIVTKVEDLIMNSVDSIFYDNQNYIINNRPTFNWYSENTNLDDISSYAISLDGSNWEYVTNSTFTFYNSLKDNSYTLYLKPIYINNTDGIITTYDFIIKTNRSITPIIDGKTVSMDPTNKENTIITWLPVENASYYEIAFNESFVDDSTIFTPHYSFFVNLESLDFINSGFNTILIRSVDNFGNKSSICRYTFLVLNDDLSNPEENYELEYYLSEEYDDTLSNSDSEPTIAINKYNISNIDKIDINVYNPKGGLVLQDSIDGLSTEYTINNVMFLNGFYRIVFEFYNDIQELLYSYEHIYLYNDIQTVTTNFRQLLGYISWNISEDYNKDDYYFKYSLYINNSTIKNYDETSNYYLNLTDMLPNGLYNFELKMYSKKNDLLCDSNTISFLINVTSSEDSRKVAMPGYIGLFVYMNVLSDSNSFIINNILDTDDNIIEGFLEYKKVVDNNYKFYKNNVLDMNTDYSFIFNRLIGG